MGILPDRNRLVAWCFAALLLNTAYIAAFAEPTVFYMGNVLAHLIGGVVFTLLALTVFPRSVSLVLVVLTLVGLYLAKAGNTFDQKWVLWTHIGFGILFTAMALRWFWGALPGYRW